MKVNVLGTDYTITRVKKGEDKYLDENNLAGYCSASSHSIVILKLKSLPEWADETDDVVAYQEKQTLRHEIVHAFYNESGLQNNCMQYDGPWAKNEEMVDWIATQFPKMLVAFQKVGAI